MPIILTGGREMSQGDADKKSLRRQQRDAYLAKVISPPQASLFVEGPGDKKSATEKEKTQRAADRKLALSQEVEKLAVISDDVSNSISVSRDCNKLLDEARGLIKQEKPDAAEILSKLDKARQRLIRAFDSRAAASRWLPRLLLFNIGLFMIFGVCIGIFKLIPGQHNLENTAWVCLACGLWGGIGSMIDAFVAMHTHFSRQDFDEHYLAWYFLHPALGLALGAVVYLVIQAGLLAVGGIPLQEASANVTGVAQNSVTENLSAMYTKAVATGGIGTTALPIAIAFFAGFRQRAALGFITRIVTAIFQRNNNDEAE
jgi:hypothetical protein